MKFNLLLQLYEFNGETVAHIRKTWEAYGAEPTDQSGGEVLFYVCDEKELVNLLAFFSRRLKPYMKEPQNPWWIISVVPD